MKYTSPLLRETLGCLVACVRLHFADAPSPKPPPLQALLSFAQCLHASVEAKGPEHTARGAVSWLGSKPIRTLVVGDGGVHTAAAAVAQPSEDRQLFSSGVPATASPLSSHDSR